MRGRIAQSPHRTPERRTWGTTLAVVAQRTATPTVRGMTTAGIHQLPRAAGRSTASLPGQLVRQLKIRSQTRAPDTAPSNARTPVSNVTTRRIDAALTPSRHRRSARSRVTPPTARAAVPSRRSAGRKTSARTDTAPGTPAGTSNVVST